ncbi:MAG: type III secretion T3S chaperone [Chlamydiales bacterium]|nr:type III secretion T3S chaperone [Chlamydiales bacterium]
MSEAQYPLEQLVIIKQKKLEEAEKVLRDKKNALLKEEEKLAKVEEERNQVKDHKHAKLTQLREVLDAGTTSDKIVQMRGYLKLVDEQLKQKEQKVKEQKKNVEAAEKQVEIARQDMVKRQQDIEKLASHRKEWDKETLKAMEHKESLEGDEMGSAMHTIRKKERNRKGSQDSKKKK